MNDETETHEFWISVRIGFEVEIETGHSLLSRLKGAQQNINGFTGADLLGDQSQMTDLVETCEQLGMVLRRIRACSQKGGESQ